MSVIELKTALTKLIVEEENTEILEAVYAILNRPNREAEIRAEMNARADKAEEDLLAGRVYTIDEVRARLSKKFEK